MEGDSEGVASDAENTSTKTDEVNLKESSTLKEDNSKTTILENILNKSIGGQQADEGMNSQETSASTQRALEEIAESILDPGKLKTFSSLNRLNIFTA